MDAAALRKLIKQLIKKYHPDLNKNAENTEITKKLTAVLNELKIQAEKNKETPAASSLCGNTLVRQENQDYRYYKLGMKYYKNIHPNFIYKRKSKTEFALKPYNELTETLNKIILSIYLAEHYFTKVILEYPGSMWRNDAIAKVKLILKLTKSYENINPNEQKVIDSARFVNEMGIRI